MKGLVLEVKKNNLIVMTPDGRFLRVHKKGHIEVGEEYLLEDAVECDRLSKFKRYSFVAASIVFFVCSVYIMSLLNVSLNTVCAYISVDINPSFELGINRFGDVLTVECINDDAEDMLIKEELKNLKVERAVQVITERAINKGYIRSDIENNILITSSDLPNMHVGVKTDKLAQSSKSVIENRQVKCNVDALYVPAEERVQAREIGLSVGKYLIYKEALEQGLEIQLKDVKDKNLNKAVRDAGGDYGNIVSQVKQNKNNSIKDKDINKPVKGKQIITEKQYRNVNDDDEQDDDDSDDEVREQKRGDNTTKGNNMQKNRYDDKNLIENEDYDDDEKVSEYDSISDNEKITEYVEEDDEKVSKNKEDVEKVDELENDDNEKISKNKGKYSSEKVNEYKENDGEKISKHKGEYRGQEASESKDENNDEKAIEYEDDEDDEDTNADDND